MYKFDLYWNVPRIFISGFLLIIVIKTMSNFIHVILHPFSSNLIKTKRQNTTWKTTNKTSLIH